MPHRPKPAVWINCFCLYCHLCWEGVRSGEGWTSWRSPPTPLLWGKDYTVQRGLPPTCVIFWAQLWGHSVAGWPWPSGCLPEESLSGAGRLILMGCDLGRWGGDSIVDLADSSSESLHSSTFPNPLGLLKCATCSFLKALFLCLDHKIAKEQWLSFKTAALKLFPTSYCCCHRYSASKQYRAPGEERGSLSSVLPRAVGEPACWLRPSPPKKASSTLTPWETAPAWGQEAYRGGGPLSLLGGALG